VSKLASAWKQSAKRWRDSALRHRRRLADAERRCARLEERAKQLPATKRVATVKRKKIDQLGGGARVCRGCRLWAGARSSKGVLMSHCSVSHKLTAHNDTCDKHDGVDA